MNTFAQLLVWDRSRNQSNGVLLASGALNRILLKKFQKSLTKTGVQHTMKMTMMATNIFTTLIKKDRQYSFGRKNMSNFMDCLHVNSP